MLMAILRPAAQLCCRGGTRGSAGPAVAVSCWFGRGCEPRLLPPAGVVVCYLRVVRTSAGRQADDGESGPSVAHNIQAPSPRPPAGGRDLEGCRDEISSNKFIHRSLTFQPLCRRRRGRHRRRAFLILAGCCAQRAEERSGSSSCSWRRAGVITPHVGFEVEDDEVQHQQTKLKVSVFLLLLDPFLCTPSGRGGRLPRGGAQADPGPSLINDMRKGGGGGGGAGLQRIWEWSIVLYETVVGRCVP